MQHFSTDSLILRAVDRGDNDKLITVLTADYGRFYAIVKGARSMHRRETAATEAYTLSNIEYYEKNGVKWVKNATAAETFPGIRYDIDKLFLAAYICEVAFELSDERQPAGDILPLALNTLYMLSTTKGEDMRIKAAFELRAACIAGFQPELGHCRRCGAATAEGGFFDVMNGAPLCRTCAEHTLGFANAAQVDEFGDRLLYLPLSASALAAVAYVTGAEDKRVFSFRLTDAQAQNEFAALCEAYLLHHLERGFPTLENFKKLTAIKPPQK